MVCADAISVELACQICKYYLNEDKRKMLIKRSGQNRNVYQQTLVKIRTCLGIKITVSLRDVALKFGLQSLLPFANIILDQYKKRTRNRIGAIQSQFLKFDNPAFEAAALSLACTKRKVNVDSERLVSNIGTTIIEYRRIRNSMLECCADLVSTSNPNKRKRVEKRETTKTSEEPEDVIPGFERTKEAAQRRIKAAEEAASREYLEWKESVLKRNKSESVDLSKPVKKKKQKTILEALGRVETTNVVAAVPSEEQENIKAQKNSKEMDLNSLLSASFA